MGVVGSQTPQSNPASPDLLCRDTAACSGWAGGCKPPRKQKPLASHGQPSVLLFPGLLGPANAVRHETPFIYVLPTLLLKHWVHLTEWIPAADGLHRQCPVHLPSSQRKTTCRYFLNCSQTPSLTFLFSFLPCSLEVQVSPWPQDCWSVGLPGEFGFWWVGPWLKECHGAQLQ